MPKRIDNQTINYIQMQAKNPMKNISKKNHIDIEGYKVSQESIGAGGFSSIHQGMLFYSIDRKFEVILLLALWKI